MFFVVYGHHDGAATNPIRGRDAGSGGRVATTTLHAPREEKRGEELRLSIS